MTRKKTSTCDQGTPSKGYIHSTVMKNCHPFDLLATLALACLLFKINGSQALRPVLTGSNMAYLNTRVVFRCSASSSSPKIIYKLVKNDRDLVATHVGYKWNWNATFPLKVKASSEGSYKCKATDRRSTGVSDSIKLTVVIPAANTRVTSDPSPPVAYEGSRIILNCDVVRGSHLHYSWFFNRKEVTSSTSIFSITGNKLVMEKVTEEHAGNYYCIAWSAVQDIRRFSTSTEVQVTIKVYVSTPKISFFIFKEGGGYHGNVSCWSLRGSPPVNFSLLLDDKEVQSVPAAESLSVWFDVAMEIGLDMGEAQCRVKTEVQDLKSEAATLEVVPVGGDVKLDVDYLYSAEAKLSTAWLSCRISRGTFPYFSWLFNNSVLPPESVDSHIQPILAHQRQTLILNKFSPEDSGYYRCRARDSYEPSGPWVQSAAVLVQVTDQILTLMPQPTSCTETPQKLSIPQFEAISLVFCCFFLLMLAVALVCVYRMLDDTQFSSANISIENRDSVTLRLSEPESQSVALQTQMFSADHDVQNQTTENTL